MTPRRTSAGLFILSGVMTLTATAMIVGDGGSAGRAVGVLAAVGAIVFLLAWRRGYRSFGRGEPPSL